MYVLRTGAGAGATQAGSAFSRLNCVLVSRLILGVIPLMDRGEHGLLRPEATETGPLLVPHLYLPLGFSGERGPSLCPIDSQANFGLGPRRWVCRFPNCPPEFHTVIRVGRVGVQAREVGGNDSEIKLEMWLKATPGFWKAVKKRPSSSEQFRGKVVEAV